MEGLQVLIASDHAGFELKSAVQKLVTLTHSGTKVQWTDLGPGSASRVDYPDFAESLAKKVAAKPGTLGVLICGSGIGMCIAANKIGGIRAAVVENTVGARLSREHNDANVICLGSRFVAAEYAAEIITQFLSTPFSQDPRHQARIQKISKLEG